MGRSYPFKRIVSDLQVSISTQTIIYLSYAFLLSKPNQAATENWKTEIITELRNKDNNSIL